MKMILWLGALLVVVPPAVLAGGHHPADDEGHGGGSPVPEGNAPHRGGGPDHEEDPPEIPRADNVRLLARRSAAAEAAALASSSSDRTRLLRDAERPVVGDASFRVRPGLRSVDDGQKATTGRLLSTAVTKDALVRAIESGDARTTDLKGADLSYAQLEGAVLTDADLTGADLSHAQLEHAVLVGADLTGADLSYANFYKADLTNAVLTNAVPTRADLKYADLTGADLTGADLSNAQFYYADFTNAVLANAVLSNSNFVLFVLAVGLTQAQVDSLATCEGVTFPSGIQCNAAVEQADDKSILEQHLADVKAVYCRVLNRSPRNDEVEKWDGWLQQASENTVKAMIQKLMLEWEFEAKFVAGKTNEEVVLLFYDVLLDREGDASGIANWTYYYGGNHDLEDLIACFIRSIEYNNKFGENTVPGGGRLSCNL